ncbi:MAG: hypothetical protein Q9208_008292 [Pyrenodesmia sp. 3 TL-2023]
MHELRHYGPDDDVAYNELFKAARDGNMRRLKEALQTSLDVNALQGPTGLAPLHIAAVNGHVDVIQLLLKNGADVDLRSSYDKTALNNAASGAHAEAVRIILDAGAQTSVRAGPGSDTPLLSVLQYKSHVSARQIETIQLLLDRGFDINTTFDSYGTRLITMAVTLKSLGLVEILIDRGSSLPDTLLSNDVDYRMAEYLLSRGAKIVGSYTGSYVIGCGVASGIATAAKAGNIETLQLLLSHANDRDIQRSGHALHLAVDADHLEIIELLLDRGFNINAHSTEYRAGVTPLLAALTAREGAASSARLVKRLLARGADVMLQDADGDTPLHTTCYYADPDVVQLLLGQGAETAARNVHGDTPLLVHAAELSGPLINKYYRPRDQQDLRVEAFKILLDSTKDVNAQNHKGHTALHALAAGHLPRQHDHDRLEAARLLLDRGADVSIRNVDSEAASDLFVQYTRIRYKPSKTDSRYYFYVLLLPPEP